MLSHPSRVRGLKHLCPSFVFIGTRVAPLAGAWIETTPYRCFYTTPKVAPLAGAWIETFRGRRLDHGGGGRTPRGCVD